MSIFERYEAYRRDAAWWEYEEKIGLFRPARYWSSDPDAVAGMILLYALGTLIVWWGMDWAICPETATMTIIAVVGLPITYAANRRHLRRARERCAAIREAATREWEGRR